MSERLWFTSDQHFGHANIIEYAHRPFAGVREMTSAIIERWNAVVQPGDHVYTLGDFGFKFLEEALKQLRGQIHLVVGSHDSEARALRHRFVEFVQIKEIKVAGQFIVMSHCAFRVWEKSHYNSWHLYGHSHGRLPGQGKSMDVGVDTNNFYPYSFEQIRDIMAKKPDNLNYIDRQKDAGVKSYVV
jgi:calcineurin-like phosphoesterase family protein